MTGFRYDLAQFYAMKATMETLFGRDCFAKLKEAGSLADWKAECDRLLRATEVAARATVAVADDQWRSDVQSLVALGRSNIKSAKAADELFSALAATYVRLSFLQLGTLPSRGSMQSVSLAERNWRLDPYRTVQYVQTPTQYRALKRKRQRVKP
jgi:hypothetical protein